MNNEKIARRKFELRKAFDHIEAMCKICKINTCEDCPVNKTDEKLKEEYDALDKTIKYAEYLEKVVRQMEETSITISPDSFEVWEVKVYGEKIPC